MIAVGAVWSVAAAISLAGVLGLCLRKNLLVMLMGLEMLLLGGVLALLGVPDFGDSGALVLIALVVGACEISIALALALIIYKARKSIWIDEVSGDD